MISTTRLDVRKGGIQRGIRTIQPLHQASKFLTLFTCRMSIAKPHRAPASEFSICLVNSSFQAWSLTCFILFSSTRSLLAGNNGLSGRVSPFPDGEVAVAVQDRGPWRGMMSRFLFQACLHTGHGFVFGPSHGRMHDQQMMWPQALATGSDGASMQMKQVYPFGRASCFSSLVGGGWCRQTSLHGYPKLEQLQHSDRLPKAYHSLTQSALESQWRTKKKLWEWIEGGQGLALYTWAG